MRKIVTVELAIQRTVDSGDESINDAIDYVTAHLFEVLRRANWSIVEFLTHEKEAE